ncbi:MAG: hypothetical protein AAF497_11785 [Planctomycetota bacterium]
MEFQSGFLAIALFVTTASSTFGEADDIKLSVVRELLKSNCRNGITFADLDRDEKPDLIVGSGAHRFNESSGAIEATPGAALGTATPSDGYHQVSIHLNKTSNGKLKLAAPSLHVPITAGSLAVPPG